MNTIPNNRARYLNDLLRRPFKSAGLTKLLAGFLVPFALATTAPAASVTLAWNASVDVNVAGYSIYYGLVSQAYTSSVDAGSNLSETITGLTPGLTYYFAAYAYDSEGQESVLSNEISNTIPTALAILTQPQSQTVSATTAASFMVAVAGAAPLSIQWYFGATAMAGATNTTLGWASVAPSNAGNYYFTVSNATGELVSSVAALTVIAPPMILSQPRSQTAVAGTAAGFTSAVNGTAPLFLQWYHGAAAIARATNSSLTWAAVTTSNAGTYFFTVSNAMGIATSSVATLTVIVPPTILTQPQSETVVAMTAASFTGVVAGTAPWSIQWYFNSAPIARATNSTLAWASVAASNAGSYYFTVSNAAGVIPSSAATLTVLSNTLAPASGAYNGLFFQTNADGTPDITEATAGFLGNCVVASNGAYSAKVYLGGLSYLLTGAFNSSGSASGTIVRTNAGLTNLTVVLQLDLTNGTGQITGAVSSTNAGQAWTSPVLGNVVTNVFQTLDSMYFWIAPGVSSSYGVATGFINNSVLSLSGTLGDATGISQTVPISMYGSVPIYVNLYNNGGLLEGWISLTNGTVTGNLTWIRPAGVLLPLGFPLGFDSIVQVVGAIYTQ